MSIWQRKQNADEEVLKLRLNTRLIERVRSFRYEGIFYHCFSIDCDCDAIAVPIDYHFHCRQSFDCRNLLVFRLRWHFAWCRSDDCCVPVVDCSWLDSPGHCSQAGVDLSLCDCYRDRDRVAEALTVQSPALRETPCLCCDSTLRWAHHRAYRS